MFRIYCLLLGYMFGLFQTGYVYGRTKGIDIRDHGSGNAGTTNTLRVLGPRAGGIVLLGDVVKCVLAIVTASLFLTHLFPEAPYLIRIYAAAGVILGHDFPFYMGFRGGKGIAASVGLGLGFHPVFIPTILLSFFLPFLLTHYVSLGSLCMNWAMLAVMVACGQGGLFAMEQGHLNEMYLVMGLLALLATFQHRGNIQKLLSGTERKTYVFRKKGKE